MHAAGRWNSLGARVVYASETLALACLEKRVHLRASPAPGSYHYFQARVPMRHVSTLDPAELPVGWDDPAVLPVTRTLGDAWLEERRSVALRVPSAIVPSEWHVLLNPLHPAFRLAWVRGPYAFHRDGRLF